MESDKFCGSCYNYNSELGSCDIVGGEPIPANQECTLPEDYLELRCGNCMSYGDWDWCNFFKAKRSDENTACGGFELEPWLVTNTNRCRRANNGK